MAKSDQPQSRQQAKSHDGLSVGEQVIWQKDPGVQQGPGEVVAIENDEGTYVRVKFDDEEQVLTFEELIRA